GGKWFERGRHQPERIQLQFQFGSRRTGFDFFAKTMQPRVGLLGFKHCDRLVKRSGLQVQQQGDGNCLQIANALICFKWRSLKQPDAPWLPTQRLSELRRKFLQLIDIIRLTDQGKRQLTGLSKIAVINLQTLNGLEASREKIEDFGIESDSHYQNRNADSAEYGQSKPERS